MKDYQPDLPAVADDTDLLRCVTTAELKGDPRLKDVGKALEKQRQASERARREAAATFKRERLPLDYRLDFGWRDRHARNITYDCTRKDDGYWYGGEIPQAECRSYDWASWRVRSDEARAEYLYSGTTTPEPPELMKRLDAAQVAVPARLHCHVDDVVPQDDHHAVRCEGGPEVRVYGDATLTAHVGDVVSVPLRDTQRDPNGVLWKDVANGGWVVDADVVTVQVDEAATCPTIDEILAVGGAR